MTSIAVGYSAHSPFCPRTSAELPGLRFHRVLITAVNPATLELRMEFFQLQHPPDVTVLCDRKGCEQVADYLEVDDYGQEYRVCAVHTDSKIHASRLPTREPSPDLIFRSRPAAWTVGGTTRAPGE